MFFSTFFLDKTKTQFYCQTILLDLFFSFWFGWWLVFLFLLNIYHKENFIYFFYFNIDRIEFEIPKNYQKTTKGIFLNTKKEICLFSFWDFFLFPPTPISNILHPTSEDFIRRFLSFQPRFHPFCSIISPSFFGIIGDACLREKELAEFEQKKKTKENATDFRSKKKKKKQTNKQFFFLIFSTIFFLYIFNLLFCISLVLYYILYCILHLYYYK